MRRVEVFVTAPHAPDDGQRLAHAVTERFRDSGFAGRFSMIWTSIAGRQPRWSALRCYGFASLTHHAASEEPSSGERTAGRVATAPGPPQPAPGLREAPERLHRRAQRQRGRLLGHSEFRFEVSSEHRGDDGHALSLRGGAEPILLSLQCSRLPR